MRQFLTYGNSLLAIEHAFSENKEQFHLLLLKKKKNEFIIANQKTANSLKAILAEIPKLTPVFVTINNQHTLHKVAPRQFSSTEEAVNFCFPALEQDTFYFEVVPLGKQTLVTICRKQLVAEIMTFYKNQNITVQCISLGNSNINTLLPYVQTKRFFTSNFCFDFDADHIVTNIQTEISPPPTCYELNGLRIENNFVLCLAGLLTLFTKTKNKSNFNTLNAKLFKTFIQSRIYFFGIRSSIAFVFGLLVLNALLFVSYQKKTNRLHQETLLMQKEVSNLNALKESVQRHKNLMTNLTENSNSKVSYYLDAIGSSVPNSVMLKSLSYQPLLKKVKAGKKITTAPNKIIISGIVHNGNDFTSWMRTLGSMPWVKSSRVIDYGTGKENQISFSIELSL